MRVKCIKPAWRLTQGGIYTVAAAHRRFCCERSHPVFEIEELYCPWSRRSTYVCPHCGVNATATAKRKGYRYAVYDQSRFVPYDDDKHMSVKESKAMLENIFKLLKSSKIPEKV